MRQTGSSNTDFRALLEHARFSNCTNTDITLLNTRVLGKAQVDLSQYAWRHAPIITAQCRWDNGLIHNLPVFGVFGAWNLEV